VKLVKEPLLLRAVFMISALLLLCLPLLQLLMLPRIMMFYADSLDSDFFAQSMRRRESLI
jgi:hypothetical protein